MPASASILRVASPSQVMCNRVGMRINPASDAAKAGSIPGVRTPIMLDGVPMASENPAPRLGQHTAEILREIGE